MCGIVGYVGKRPCRDLLVAGLEKLEYRGYDSAGISLLEDGQIDSVRAVGNLANLRAELGIDGSGEGGVAVAAPPATIGLAHTRWATHGRVTEENAHPHGDCATTSTSSSTGSSRTTPSFAATLEADGHTVQLRDGRRDRRPPDREALRRATSPRRFARRSPRCAATTRSSPCTPTIPTRSSPLDRSAR